MLRSMGLQRVKYNLVTEQEQRKGPVSPLLSLLPIPIIQQKWVRTSLCTPFSYLQMIHER